jgi:catechol 2,3-dioxygenase-like lactoylglutathione lyase family enzyme
MQYDLDHVALAAPDTSEALKFLTGELAGTVIFGGQSVGFRPMQVFVGGPDGDGMPVELLEPWLTEQNDFLARFLARHGPGPHHMTFKVPSISDALARLQGAWKEAFLMPREAHGTVVQIAQTTNHQETRAEWLAHVAQFGPNEQPRWWTDPAPPQGPPARLRRVVLRTPVLAAAVAFFSGIMQGDVERETGTRVDLVWPGGARIGLDEQRAATPGIDRLEVEGLAAERTVVGTRFVPLS